MAQSFYSAFAPHREIREERGERREKREEKREKREKREENKREYKVLNKVSHTPRARPSRREMRVAFV